MNVDNHIAGEEMMPYIETQFETDTMNAVPAPLLLVGDRVFAAQLLTLRVNLKTREVERHART
jgi:hypothetical protein